MRRLRKRSRPPIGGRLTGSRVLTMKRAPTAMKCERSSATSQNTILTLTSPASWSGPRTPAMRRLKMTEASLSQAVLLEAAEQKQRRAADPAVSAWVRANAGTGKTHVLVQRILRLLLSGVNPRSILCLTFTKNAAAEMEARVLATLGEWVTSSHEDLKVRLAGLLSPA